MRFTLICISIILLSHTPVQCQRRGSYRSMRQGNRKQPVFREERARGMRPQLLAPNCNTNKAVPAPTPCQKPAPTPCQKVVEPPCPKVFEAVPQVLQNIPKAPDVPKTINMPMVPNMEFTQNMLLSPDLQLIQAPQIIPNQQPIPNVPVPIMPIIQGPNLPIIQGANLQNLQYLQNVQLVSNVPLVQELPVQNVPLLEVPIPAPEKIRVQIPYPPMEPPEPPCSCISPTPFTNTFLPAASPVSAWSPPSNLLPPITQTRSHFLRKIPIPPPTL